MPEADLEINLSERRQAELEFLHFFASLVVDYTPIKTMGFCIVLEGKEDEPFQAWFGDPIASAAVLPKMQEYISRSLRLAVIGLDDARQATPLTLQDDQE